MVRANNDLWSLALDRRYVDPEELAEAIQAEAGQEQLDFRTRVLIRDGIHALTANWEKNRLNSWLSNCPNRQRIEAILREDLGRPGFPSLRTRVVELTKPEVIERYFRDLSSHLRQPLRVVVGGSVALILTNYLSRRTEDIDIVDEVPAEIRNQHLVLEQLKKMHKLHLGHFQSHYLPSGWELRIHSHDSFGPLQVFLVDVYDVFLSKLFSIREKDKGDLLEIAPQLDKETLIRRFRDTTASTLASPNLRERATKNWYVLFGEDLPT